MHLTLPKNKCFIRFLLAGGFAAAVNFCSRILLNFIFSYDISIVFAYLIGMVTAFILCKYCVFEAKDSTKSTKELFIFTIVNIFALLQTLIVSVVLHEYIFPAWGIFTFSKEIAHAIGVIVPVFSSYFGHKYFSFASSSFSQKTNSKLL